MIKSIKMLFLQKKGKKIIISKENNAYKLFMRNKKLMLKDLTLMPTPYNSRYLWIFFDVFMVKIQSSVVASQLLHFDFFQTSLLKNKGNISPLYPYYYCSSFRFSNFRRLAPLFLNQNSGLGDTNSVLDRQDQFLVSEVSKNLNTEFLFKRLSVKSERKTYFSFIQKISEEVYKKRKNFTEIRQKLNRKYLNQILKKPYSISSSDYGFPSSDKRLIVNKRTDKNTGIVGTNFSSRKFLINSSYNKWVNFLKSESLTARLSHKIPRRFFVPFFDYLFERQPNFFTFLENQKSKVSNFLNEKRFTSILSFYFFFFFNVTFRHFNKFFFFSGVRKKVLFELQICFFINNFFRKIQYLKNTNILNLVTSYPRITLAKTYVLNKLVSKCICLLRISLLTEFVKPFIYVASYAIANSNSLVPKIQNLQLWQYHPVLFQQLSNARATLFSEVLEIKPLLQTQYDAPGIFMNNFAWESETEFLYSSKQEVKDNTLDLFYSPELSFSERIRRIKSYMKTVPWEIAKCSLQRWNLFSFLKTENVNSLNYTAFTFFSKVKNINRFDPSFLLKYKSTEARKVLLFFSNQLINRKSFSVNKLTPLNLHKVFLSSLQNFFYPLAQNNIMPIFFSKRLDFLRSLDFAKPLRIVFSPYKQRKRSLQVHILDSTNANLYSAWPGLVIKQISKVVGYDKAHKFTFLRFMKPKLAKTNFMAKILTMRAITNYLYKYVKKYGGIFELIIKTNLKLFDQESNLLLFTNIINSSDLSFFGKFVQKNLKKNKISHFSKNSNLKNMTSNSFLNTFKTSPSSEFRYVRFVFGLLSSIRKFFILLLFVFLKRPNLLMFAEKSLHSFKCFLPIVRFHLKSQLSLFLFNLMYRSYYQRININKLKLNSVLPFSFLKRRASSGFFALNQKMLISKIAVVRSVRHGYPLKKKKNRRL